MFCRCCEYQTEYIWTGKVLEFEIKYYECPRCKYVQTETPYWLEKAYSSVINDSDTGIVIRNIVNSKIVASTILNLNIIKLPVVDYAGGYGLLVRMLRDFGISAYWMDPYCTNLFAKKFEFDKNQNVGLVCAFEVMEHVLNPIETIDSMLAISPNLLISTLIMPDKTPDHDNWWYYGKNHGQHIGFFRISTFQYIAKLKNKYLATDGKSYFLFSDKKMNNFQFRFSILLNKFSPYFLKLFLKSKTYSDSKFLENLT